MDFNIYYFQIYNQNKCRVFLFGDFSKITFE